MNDLLIDILFKTGYPCLNVLLPRVCKAPVSHFYLFPSSSALCIIIYLAIDTHISHLQDIFQIDADKTIQV